MMDEYFDRIYQAGRGDLNAGIDRLVARIAAAIVLPFKELERIQFAAPWKSSGKA